MTEPGGEAPEGAGNADGEDSRPISVAELLARNGTIGAPPAGGRRRRRRGNSAAVTVAELTGEIPVIRDEPPAEVPAAEVQDEPADEVAEDVPDEVYETSSESEDDVDHEKDVEAEADDEAVVEAESEADVVVADEPESVDDQEDESLDDTSDEPSDETSEELTDEAAEEESEAADEDEVAEDEVAEDEVAEEQVTSPPLSEEPRPRRENGPELSHDPRPVRRSLGAEQMAPDPVDQPVDLAGLVAEQDQDVAKLRSYLKSSGGTLFGGQSMADDLARRGIDSEADDDAALSGGAAAPVLRPAGGRTAALRHGAIAVGQSALAVVFGAGLFIAFDQLWRWNNLVALVLSVLVILGLVVAVRVVRKTEDIASTLIAVAVGALVTLGPLALLQST